MTGLGRKVSFLAIVAVIATAVMGAAYTLWYEDLELHANVATGEMDGTIVCATDKDNELVGWPAPPSVLEPFASYPKADPLKDVADPPISVQGDDVHEWLVELSNTYPGYMYDCELHVGNTGDVPWHVELAKITVEYPDGSLHYGICSGSKCTFGDRDPYTPALSPVYVEIHNFTGCQVHADEDVNASLFIGVNQSALEAAHYKIWLSYQVNQWNESAWDGCTNNGPIPRPGNQGPVLPPI